MSPGAGSRGAATALRRASPGAPGAQWGGRRRTATGQAHRTLPARGGRAPAGRRSTPGGPGTCRTRGDRRGDTPPRTRCIEAPSPTTPSSCAEAEAVGEDGQHLLDPVPQRVLAEGALEGVLADGPGLVGMGEVEIELAPELVQIAIGDDLLAGLEQGPQLVLPVHDLARAARGQLEGPGVDPHDVVHRVMVVQRQRRARVDR